MHNTRETLRIALLLVALLWALAPTLAAAQGAEATPDTPAVDAGGDEAVPAAEPADAEVAAEAPPAEPVDTAGTTIHERGGLAGLGLVVGLKAGGGFSQMFSPLGMGFVGELELGYNLPLPQPVGRDLGLFLAGAYAGPMSAETVSEADTRLPGDGSWSYDMIQHQAIITFGLIYRIPIPTDIARPYLAAGGRTYLTKTVIEGDAAKQAFGTNEETGTSWGGYGALGCDFFVGPGALLFEVQMGYAPLDGTIIKDSSTGALNVALGYRIFI